MTKLHVCSFIRGLTWPHLCLSHPIPFPLLRGPRTWPPGWEALLQAIYLGELLLGHKMTVFSKGSEECTVPPTMWRSCICSTFPPVSDLVSDGGFCLPFLSY